MQPCPLFYTVSAILVHLCFLLNLFLHLQLYKKFKVPGPTTSMGLGKEWNVDLIPKFCLGSGESLVHLNL